MVNLIAVAILAFALPVWPSPMLERSAADIEGSIATINADLERPFFFRVVGQHVTLSTPKGRLNLALGDFTLSPTVELATNVQLCAVSLQDALEEAATVAQNTGSIAAADAITIIAQLQKLEPAVKSALGSLLSNEGEFVVLPFHIVGVVEIDLDKLHIAFNAFSVIIIEDLPVASKGEASNIQLMIEGYFKPVLAAYANA